MSNTEFHLRKGMRRPARSRLLSIAPLVLLAFSAFLLFQGSPAARPPGAVRLAKPPAASLDQSRRIVRKPIADVRPGDIVLSRDEHSGENVEREVVEAFQRVVAHLRIVEVSDPQGDVVQTIETTDEHPFWVRDAGWVNARDLAAGDELVGAAGQPLLVASARSEPHPEGIPVFNFKVAGTHSYFVASAGSPAPPLLVHNANCGPHIDVPLEDLVASARRVAPRGAGLVRSTRR